MKIATTLPKDIYNETWLHLLSEQLENK